MRDTMEFSGITLRGLRIFVALEEQKSISAAAGVLGLSKSNVSQSISTLETELGTLLFDRKQRPIGLTPTGQLLSLHAQRILSAVSDAEAALAASGAGSLPILNFAIIDDLDASITPVMATALQAQLVKSAINVYSGRSDEVTSRLISREADIAVTASIPANIQKFQIQPLFREQFVLVTARGAYEPNDDWRAQLGSLPLVQYSETMPMGQLVSVHLKRLGIAANPLFSFETTRSVVATVAHAKGWTLSTPSSVMDASRFLSDIDLHPLPFAALSRQVFLVNRVNEFGMLPQLLADDLRHLLASKLLPEFTDLAPELATCIEISGQDAA